MAAYYNEIDPFCAQWLRNLIAAGHIAPAAGFGAPHIRERLYWVAYTSGEGRRQVGRDTAGDPEKNKLRQGDRSCYGSKDVQSGRLGDAEIERRERRPDDGDQGRWERAFGQAGSVDRLADSNGGNAGPTNGFWRAADWLSCTDGKWRPVEPGAFPLADGIASRVGRLRAYGNAIVAPQAQAFIEAAMAYAP